MRHRIRAIVAAVLFAAACSSDGPAGPDGPVLTGQFGSADEAVELLATRAGVELDDECGSYFVSETPLAPAADGSFRVRGRVGSPFSVGTGSATLSGQATYGASGTTLVLTVTIDDARPPAVWLSVTLARGTHYSGPTIYCPA